MNRVKVGRIGRHLVAVSALAAGLALAASAPAQIVTDDETPNTGLDLPSNLQIFGKVDPNIRKPTAIVNRVVITGTDVDQRMALIASLNELKLTAEIREQLRLQVLRGLIDETLQVQEAETKDIKITPEEVDQGFARVARNFKRSPAEMKKYLKEIGSSEASLDRQIQGELAWSRLLSAQVEPFINVGTEEVQAVIDRLQAAQGTEEYHIKEIYLSATADRSAEVQASMQKMLEQMRQGAPFEYFASTFSEASTRASQGDLGWIRIPVLPDSLATVTQQMQVGQVAGPIEVPGGFSMLYLVDKRQVLVADKRDAKLSLRQLTIRFPAGTTQAQAAQRAADFASATQQIQGCGGVAPVAEKIGAEVVDNDSVVARQLPQALQDMLLSLQVGQASPPFGSAEDGVRVLVLCGRDDPEVANLPSMDEIRQNMENERVSLRAQRLLRDLRRDAVVEYR